VVEPWARGSWLEQRAVVAGLCEPALLQDPALVADVLRLLNDITRSMTTAPCTERTSAGFRALRQALAYGWSVAVVANPARGEPLRETWLRSADRDAAWMARENLKKHRLKRMDPVWVTRWAAH
jgi:hypothetical protein